VFCAKNIRESGAKELSVTEYIEVDLQAVSTASLLPKLAGEYRNYLNSLQGHVEGNYELEMA
jgi:hypothetical protein